MCWGKGQENGHVGSRRPIVNMVGGEAQLLQLLPAEAISSLLRGVNVYLGERNMGEESGAVKKTQVEAWEET